MKQLNRPRVLLADDHRIVAEALASLLSPEFEVVGVVEDGLALLAAARRLRPDVIVTDITMPHLNGLEALPLLKKDDPKVKIIVLTMHQHAGFARRALEAGASGFVVKHSAPTELVAAIRAALAGKTYLTPTLAGEVVQSALRDPERARDPVASLSARQREILKLLAEGRSAREIGALLEISPRTVEFHKYQMMQTLNVQTSAELIHFTIKHGIVSV